MEFLATYWIYMAAAAAIAAVLLLGIVVTRMLNRRVRGRKGQRLAISEYHEVDETRRLVLVRRDETEHLLLIGGAQDLVVESGINLNSPMMEEDREPARQPIPIRAAPRAPVFGDRRPVLRPVEPEMMTHRSFENGEN
jgi:flagellar biogenesis protein FliO